MNDGTSSVTPKCSVVTKKKSFFYTRFETLLLINSKHFVFSQVSAFKTNLNVLSLQIRVLFPLLQPMLEKVYMKLCQNYFQLYLSCTVTIYWAKADIVYEVVCCQLKTAKACGPHRSFHGIWNTTV